MLPLRLLSLQRINKIRPLIAQLMDFLALTHARTQAISLTSPPSSILSNKQLSHQQAAAKEEKHHVREDNAVSEIVLRLVFCAVDVGGDDSIQITLLIISWYSSRTNAAMNSPNRSRNPS